MSLIWRVVQVGLLFIFLAMHAWSAEAPTIRDLLQLDLEELADYQVVTPTKTGTSLKDAPGSVSLISYEQIQASSARTIPELLRLVPGVNVRWNPMVQTIDIRSFGSNPFTSKVLLLIDGIPYNSWNKGGFPQHPGFDFFNINNVKHLEVVRGPGSALYGENAFNGVINIVTLSGEEFRQTSLTAYAGSRDTRGVSIAHGSKLAEQASVFTSLRADRARIPTGLWDENGGSEADSYDLFLKAKVADIQFSYYRRDDSFDGYSHDPQSSDLPSGSRFNSAPKIDQEINIAALRYDGLFVDDKLSVQTNLSYSNRDGSHCAACHDPRGMNPDEHEDHAHDFSNPNEDHGYQLFGSAQASWRGIPNHDILIGYEWRKIDAGDHTDELFNDNGESVFGYRKSAIFIQDEISLLDGKLDAVVGLRYEGSTSPSLFGSELFPRISLVNRATDNLTIRAGWSEAARYPSFTELYQNSAFLANTFPLANPPPPPADQDFYFPLALFRPNVDMQPEEIETIELGFAYVFSSTWRSNLDFYINKVKNPIAVVYPGPATPPPPDTQFIGFENHPSNARVRGFEAELRAEINPQLSGYLNWSFQRSTASSDATDSGGTPLELTYAPKHKVALGAQYEPLDSLSTMLEIAWRDEYLGPNFWFALDGVSPEPLESYAIINLSAQYRLPFTFAGGKRPLTLVLQGKNLSDEEVFETLTGFGGTRSGREVFVSLEYDWTL